MYKNDVLSLWKPFNAFSQVWDPFYSNMPKLGIEHYLNDDKSLVYVIDVPGIKESDLTIEVENNTVVVKGERKTHNSSLKLHKSFSVSKDYNLDNVNAELSDGLLTLTFPLKEKPPEKIKQIPIKTK